ncbi:MAG TPA: hypothetical protein VD970_10035 [Acetobacteraceae bacterium]|nr:hypothetical protein [Acetobacteraceae bacterium]
MATLEHGLETYRGALHTAAGEVKRAQEEAERLVVTATALDRFAPS